MYGIIPGFTKVGGWFELFFVNTLGMSYNSGVIAYLLLLVASTIWALLESLSDRGDMKRARIAFLLSIGLAGILFIGNSVWLWLLLIGTAIYLVFTGNRMNFKFINLSMSSLLVILIGFSAYAIIPIRSSANPPLDLNSPEDIFSLGSYLNREQYGQTPIIYGTTYASQIVRDNQGRAVVSKERKSYSRVLKTDENQKDRYVASTIPTYKYSNTMLFPRMHTHPSEPGYSNHIQAYEVWGGVTDWTKKPTLFDNLKFSLQLPDQLHVLALLHVEFSGSRTISRATAGSPRATGSPASSLSTGLSWDWVRRITSLPRLSTTRDTINITCSPSCWESPASSTSYGCNGEEKRASRSSSCSSS